jgi:flagellar M-ring protein FliF
MLERSLGTGHVHAEASVQLNFDKTADTQEKYDPDSPVVRSTQNVTSNSKSTERNGAVSVQNNLPNADSGNQATGNQEGKQEETTNYEISKTVHTSTRDQPRVERVTLAVMVDGVDEVGPDGKHNWRPRAQPELDQIERLAKSAIGYDEKRGDHVEVVSMPFINEIGPAEAEAPVPAVKVRRDLITLGEAAAIGITALVIIVLMTRSIIHGLKPPPLSFGMAGAAELPGGETSVGAPGTALALTGPSAVAGAAAGGTADGEVEDSTISMSNIEGQIRASSIRQLVDLTSRHPDATLAIIRNWLATGGG